MTASPIPALSLTDLSKEFGGLRALDGVSLAVGSGERRAIIGPNGAGKTTMMDVITGKTRPDAGRAFFGSTIDLLRLRENDIASIGIGRKFQKPTVFEPLSVFENLELALKADRGVRSSMFFRLSGEQLDRIASTAGAWQQLAEVYEAEVERAEEPLERHARVVLGRQRRRRRHRSRFAGTAWPGAGRAHRIAGTRRTAIGGECV